MLAQAEILRKCRKLIIMFPHEANSREIDMNPEETTLNSAKNQSQP